MDTEIDNFEQEYKDEKLFSGVAKKSIKYFVKAKKRFWFVYILVFITSMSVGMLIASSQNIISTMNNVLITMLSVGGTILGFIIAGFAIYAAMSDRELMYRMILFTPENENVSQFHKNLLYFFEPFLFVGCMTAVSVFWFLIDAAVPILISRLPSLDHVKLIMFVPIGLYLFMTYLAFISVKDFIFNIYQIAVYLGRFELYRRKGYVKDHHRS